MHSVTVTAKMKGGTVYLAHSVYYIILFPSCATDTYFDSYHSVR